MEKTLITNVKNCTLMVTTVARAKFFLFLAALFVPVQICLGAPATLAECTAYASRLNANFPQRIDNVTIVKGTVCLPIGKEVVLQYIMQIDVDNSAAKQADLDKLVPRMTKTWCTDPTQKELLKAVTIGYKYSDKSGVFVGNIFIRLKDC